MRSKPRRRLQRVAVARCKFDLAEICARHTNPRSASSRQDRLAKSPAFPGLIVACGPLAVRDSWNPPGSKVMLTSVPRNSSSIRSRTGKLPIDIIGGGLYKLAYPEQDELYIINQAKAFPPFAPPPPVGAVNFQLQCVRRR